MRASEVLAVAAFAGAAQAAPAPYGFCIWPFCGDSGSSQPSTTSYSSTVKSTSTSCTTTSKATSTSSIAAPSTTATIQTMYGQCGGSNWTGPTKCAAPASCVTGDGGWYAQCTTGVASSSSAAATTSSSSKVSSSSSSAVASSSSSVVVSKTSSSSSSVITSAPVTSSSSSSSSVVLTTSSSTSAAPVATVVASQDGYNSLGGAIEPFNNGLTGVRALQGDHFTSSNMTIDLCQNYCSALGYSFFGTEYASECYCGNAIADGTTVDTQNTCYMPCSGDATELCGGPGCLQLYEVAGGPAINLPTTYTATATATATGVSGGSGSGSGASATATGVATAVASAGGYTYAGCAVEAYNVPGLSYRSLQDDSISTPNMTVEFCADFCSDFDFFGVEYGAECYCANSVAVGTTQDVTGAGCNFPCAADATEQCGGSAHFNLYSNGQTALNLPLTFAAQTTSTTVAIPTSSVVVAPTTSSVVASVTSSSSSAIKTVSSSSSSVVSTSSASKTSSSSSSAVSSTSAKPTTTSCTTSSTVKPTTMVTSTKTSSAVASQTPGTCAPKSADLSVCPALQISSPFGLFKAKNFYSGSGYTMSHSNPANLLSWLFPPKTYTFPSTMSICSAATQCMSQAGLLTTLYHSFDLHYKTDSCSWECTLFQGQTTVGSYFNQPNPNVSHGCGFSGGLF